MNFSQKPILLLFGTHGDEYILKNCLEYIPKELHQMFDTLDVNEEAIKANKRFITHDMNRHAPGYINSEMYELRRSAEVQNIMSSYEVVIDIHGTLSDTGSFVLLPKATPQHIFLSSLLQSQNIVLWQSGVKKSHGPIVGFHPLGLEIETGPMNDTMIRVLAENLSTFFTNFQKKYSFSEQLDMFQKKDFYNVVGRLERTSTISSPEKDFQKIQINGTDFYTLLTNNPYPHTKCYLMKKLTQDEILVTSQETFQSEETIIQ